MTPPIMKSVTDEMKELLAEESNKIKLEDFINIHIKKFIEATDITNFPFAGANIQNEDIVERIKALELATADLQKIVVLIAKWGDGKQVRHLDRILQRLSEAEDEKEASGVNLWINLAWYPLHLLIYSAGIAALSEENFLGLARIFNTKTSNKYGESSYVLIKVVDHLTEIQKTFNIVSGNKDHHVPLSEYLFQSLGVTVGETLYLQNSFELLFDEFEVMLALSYANNFDNNWGPIGRFGWKHSSRTRHESPLGLLLKKANKTQRDWRPIKEGLFGGSFEDFEKTAKAFEERMNSIHW